MLQKPDRATGIVTVSQYCFKTYHDSIDIYMKLTIHILQTIYSFFSFILSRSVRLPAPGTIRMTPGASPALNQVASAYKAIGTHANVVCATATTSNSSSVDDARSCTFASGKI